MACQFDERSKTFASRSILPEGSFSAKGKTKKEAKNNEACLAVKKLKLGTKYSDSKTVWEESAKLYHFNMRKKRVSRKKRQLYENDCAKDHDLKSLCVIRKGNSVGIGQALTFSEAKKEAVEEVLVKQHSVQEDSIQEPNDGINKRVNHKVSTKLEIISRDKLKSLRSQCTANKRAYPSQLILPNISNSSKKKKHTSSVKGKVIQAHDRNKKASKKTLVSEHVNLPNVFDTRKSKKIKKSNKNKKMISSMTQVRSNALGEQRIMSFPSVPNIIEKTVLCKKNVSLPNQMQISDEFQTMLPPNTGGQVKKKKKRNKKGSNMIQMENSIKHEREITSNMIIIKKKKSKHRNKVNAGNKIEKCKPEEAVRYQLSKDTQIDTDKPDQVKSKSNSPSTRKRNLKALVFNKQSAIIFSNRLAKMQQQQQTDTFHTDLPSLNQMQDSCNRFAAKKKNYDGTLKPSIPSINSAKSCGSVTENLSCFSNEEKHLFSCNNSVKTKKAESCGKENKNIEYKVKE